MKKTLSLILFTLIVGISCTFGQEGIDQYQLANGWYRFEDGLSISPDNFIANYKANWGLVSNDVLTLARSEGDDLGYSHYYFNQFYQGYEVEHVGLSLHYDATGLLVAANGSLVSGLDLTLSINVTEVNALQTALTYLNASEYAWQNEALETELKEETGDSMSTYYPMGKLLINHDQGTPLSKDNFHFAYKFVVETSIPQDQLTIYVDATTGNVLSSRSNAWNCNVGSCTTSDYGTQSIEVTHNSVGVYRLQECSRNIHTKFSQGFGIEVTDNDGNWGTSDQDATAAHWCGEKAWDYYKNIHNRTGSDNASKKLELWVHDTWADNEARWVTSGPTWNPWMKDKILIGSSTVNGESFGVLDIVGHEFTHAIANFKANHLTTSGESGALAESFGDIFGTMIERYAQGTFDWTMGEDKNIIDRSLENPPLFNQPDVYLTSPFWASTVVIPNDPTNDNGGIHTNLGVQNKWFYFLCQGNQDFNGIGVDKAAKIAFRNMINYLELENGYPAARAGSINAAMDLFGICSREVLAVTQAWDAVGVFGSENFSCIYLNGSSTACTQTLPMSITASTTSNIANYNISWSGIPSSWTTSVSGAHNSILTITSAPIGTANIIATVYQNNSSSGFLKKIASSVHPIQIKEKCFGRMIKEVNSLIIFPNPANDLLSINLKNGETNGKAEIFDVQGQLVQQCDLLQSETKVSVANIASGIYFVRVTTNEATYQSKLQIIH